MALYTVLLSLDNTELTPDERSATRRFLDFAALIASIVVLKET